MDKGGDFQQRRATSDGAFGLLLLEREQLDGILGIVEAVSTSNGRKLLENSKSEENPTQN